MQDMAHLVGPAAQKSALQEPQILPEAVLRRLPRYYQCLLALYAQGQGRIRSTTLAGYLGMLPAQVRRDMRLLQAQGRRGYGYHVLPLLDRLGRLLGLKEGYRAVLYTEGGQAISAAALARGGFSLLAVASPAGQEEEAGWPHLAPGELYAFCQREAVQLLLYAGQAPVPQLDLAALAAAGVRAVLNLSEAELPAQDGLYIYNFRLTDALMALSLSLRWGLHGGCAPAGGTEEGGAPS